MQAKENNKPAREPARERPDLDRRYGKIGISALAAALHYCSAAKNPASAPAQSKEEREDVAA